MRTLYLLCGVSFSGKSTLARALLASRPLGYISLDDINHERGLGFGGDGIPVEEWERTHAVARERLAGMAASGQDVLLDDTCCFRWLRDRWRTQAQDLGYRTQIIYLDTPREEIERRRAQNERSRERHGIQEAIFQEHVSTFEPPMADEPTLRFTPRDEPSSWLESHLRRQPS
jgi:predicted kinase